MASKTDLCDGIVNGCVLEVIVLAGDETIDTGDKAAVG